MAKEKPARGQGRLLPLRIWDAPTRLLHWTLVSLIVAAWATAELDHMDWHARVGQAILTLVVFRLIWGIVGSQTAQFWTFIKSPKAVWTYARGLLKGHVPAIIGHNPMGASMIIALLVLIAVQGSLGLMSNDDVFFEGPLFHLVDKELSDTLTGLDHLIFNIIMLAALVHICAALFYLLVKRDNLIGPMITGRTWWPEPLPRVRMTPGWMALPVLGIAAALVWAAVNYL